MKKLFLIIVVLAMISCFGNTRTSSRRTASRTSSRTETVQREETVSSVEETGTQPEMQESTVPEQLPVQEETAPAAAETSAQDFEAFKKKMDDLEAFFDSYVEFCRAYDVSDTGMMLQYLDMMNKYNDAMKALDSIDESKLTPEEDAYYIQTMLRIDQKLLEAANALNQ